MIGILSLALGLAGADVCPPSQEAHMVKAAMLEVPGSERRFYPARVTLSLHIGPDGKPMRISVIRSSGNDVIDRAAITAASLSTYSPKIDNCVAVEGDYAYRATFL